MKRTMIMTLFIASMVLLGIRSAAAVVMVDFVPAPPIPVAFGDMFDVDVVVSGLGGDSVSAYDVDITYDPFLLLPGAVSFAGELGLPDIETITGAFDLFGILDVFEVSLLSDAELGALQNGSEVTLFTVSFEALDDGVADLSCEVGQRSNRPDGHSSGATCVIRGRRDVVSRTVGDSVHIPNHVP